MERLGWEIEFVLVISFFSKGIDARRYFFFLFSFLALNSSRSSHFAFFFLHWCLGHGWVGLD